MEFARLSSGTGTLGRQDAGGRETRRAPPQVGLGLARSCCPASGNPVSGLHQPSVRMGV